MKLLSCLRTALCLLGLLAMPAAAAYPEKPINMIIAFTAGGSSDVQARIMQKYWNKYAPQPWVFVYKPGAGGIIGFTEIAKARPDGYTIGMITFELATYKPSDMSDYTYENYDAICRINTDAAAVTVNAKWAADNGITDLATFVDYCKAHPGEVKMGGSSAGSVWHIAGGYLMNAADIDIKMITYADGAAGAVKAAAQQEIEGVTVSLAEARSFIESGDLICLGVMDTERNATFSDIPTCQEQGFDCVYATQRGLAFPKGVDEGIRAKMAEACAAAIADPDFVAQMASFGQAISYMDAEEYTAYLAQAAIDVPPAMEAVDLL